MSRRCLLLTLIAILLCTCSLSLTGCGAGIISSAPPSQTSPPLTSTYAGVAFSGKVLSGTIPIPGAAIQLYAAGTTGNASPAAALLSTTVTTDAAGSFAIPASYPCPGAASQLYLIARGGKPGPSISNPAIVLSTVLGACNQIDASSQFIVNEVTTAATAWGLAQFAASPTALGASATNSIGLVNAFSTVANLVNPATGISPGATFPATGKSPAAKINTVANLLNTCTSTAGDFTACSQLFIAATPAGAPAPTNTFDAALNIVRNPGLNVAALFNLAAAKTTFTPALAKAPSDWTLFINYIGGGMNAPGALGVDSTGNIWISSYSDPTGVSGVVSKFSPLGAPAFASGITVPGLKNSYGLAIDASDNVWIPYESSPYAVNKGLGSIFVINSSGQSISGPTGFSSGGIFYPIAVAIDTNGTAWIVDYGNAHVTLLSNTGQPLSGASGYSAPSFAFPVSIAIDANHNGWVGDQNDDVITRISAAGTQPLRVSCCNGPNGLAIDQRGSIWASNFYSDSVSRISTDGAILSSNLSGGGILHPQGTAIDGSGNVWIANFRGPSLTQLAGSTSSHPGQPLSPGTGWGRDAAMLEAFAIAIDASGNLWITNFGNNSLTEFVGLAAPVKTPLLGPPQAP